MDPSQRHDLFCELLTRYQGQVYGYILAMVRNTNDADDLFQTTSMILWRKFDSFQQGSSFFGWARRTAEFEVRNFLKTRNSRFTPLTESLLDALADTEPSIRVDDADAYLAGLRHCTDKLPERDRELLGLSYAEGLSAQQIGDNTARSRQSVCNSLLRIRRELYRCIAKQLARERNR